MNLFTEEKQTHRCQKKNLWLPKGKCGREDRLSLGLTYTHYYI